MATGIKTEIKICLEFFQIDRNVILRICLKTVFLNTRVKLNRINFVLNNLQATRLKKSIYS